MSTGKDKNSAKQWIRQAHDDYESAVILLEAKKFAQSCFYFQQAAEKSLKSLWYFYGESPWGHSVSRLMETLPEDDTREDLISTLNDEAMELDKFYITTRYPNGLPSDLIPAEAYTKKNATDAKQWAQKIINKIDEYVE